MKNPSNIHQTNNKHPSNTHEKPIKYQKSHEKKTKNIKFIQHPSNIHQASIKHPLKVPIPLQASPHRTPPRTSSAAAPPTTAPRPRSAARRPPGAGNRRLPRPRPGMERRLRNAGVPWSRKINVMDKWVFSGIVNPYIGYK